MNGTHWWTPTYLDIESQDKGGIVDLKAWRTLESLMSLGEKTREEILGFRGIKGMDSFLGIKSVIRSFFYQKNEVV